MNKEDKEFLLRDLCGRLPYRVKYSCTDIKNVWRLKTIFTRSDNSVFCDGCNDLELCRPYLFPLSSMTEEQDVEYDATFATIVYEDGRKDSVMTYKSFNWLNKNHFDYRGLIEKGLAIDCTELNIY